MMPGVEICPVCRVQMGVGMAFCKSCGATSARGRSLRPASDTEVCHACRAPLVPGAWSCNSCGMLNWIPRPQTMRVCLRCGARGTADVCSHCGAQAWGELRSRYDGIAFARVAARLGCPACGADVPFGLQPGGELLACPACAHAAGPNRVVPVLAAAHSVLDLATAEPEGRWEHHSTRAAPMNPYADAGMDAQVIARHEVRPEDARREVRVAPGHPACGRCCRLLDVVLADPNTMILSCPSCGFQARAETPAGLAGLYYGLRGVLRVSSQWAWLAFGGASLLRFGLQQRAIMEGG